MRVAPFTPNGGENDIVTPAALPSGSEQYVAVTYNNSNLTGNLISMELWMAQLYCQMRPILPELIPPPWIPSVWIRLAAMLNLTAPS